MNRHAIVLSMTTRCRDSRRNGMSRGCGTRGLSATPPSTRKIWTRHFNLILLGTTMAKIHDQLAHFVRQRHIAYLWRKHGGAAPSDWVLRTYRFCNLSRRLDRGTQALYAVYAKLPVTALPHIVVVARCVNSADVLQELLVAGALGGSYTAQTALDVLNDRMARGLPIRENAYMATTHGRQTPWAQFYAEDVWQHAWDRRELLNDEAVSLGHYANRMQRIQGIGSFIAGQIVADLKDHVGWMLAAPDREDFAVSGPGSKRGYARLNSTHDWHDTVLIIRDWANEILADMRATYMLDAQDAQNVLCEFDKYMRVVDGGHLKRKL